MMSAALRESDLPEGFKGAAVTHPQGDKRIGIEHGQLDVFQCRGARQEVEALEDESELAVA